MPRSARSSPGTTTSGGSRTACATWHCWLAGASARRGRVRSLRDLELRGRRVFLRADLNVPLDQGRISDRTRIEATLPSLRFVLERGGRLLVASHLGRPDGERRPELSLAPVAEVLSEALRLPVELAPDCIGETTEQRVNTL